MKHSGGIPIRILAEQHEYDRVPKVRLGKYRLCVYKIMHERGSANCAMADGYLPEPAPPAPTDPRLPLNARQVFKLQKSWKGIKRNLNATGLEMFVR